MKRITYFRSLNRLIIALLYVVASLSLTNVSSAHATTNDKIFFFYNNDSYSIDTDGSNLTNVGGLGSYNLSPDGTKAAYSDGTDIFIKNTTNGNTVNLTHSLNIPEVKYKGGARWSPDGTKLMFGGQGGNFNQNFWVYTINPDGTNLHLVTSSLTPDEDSTNWSPIAPTSWSPDGSKILMTQRNRDTQVFELKIIDTNGNVLSTFSNGVDNYDTPSWSPDGTKIAFMRGINGFQQQAIDIMNVDGTGRQDIVGPISTTDPTQPYFIEAPIWSPDSSKLVYYKGNWGDPDNSQLIIKSVYTQEPDVVVFTGNGGDPSQWWHKTVTDNNPPSLTTPAWSQNPKPTTGSTTLTIPATDDVSGIQKAEYFIGDTDPGQGNSTTMQLSNVTNEGLSASLTTTFGTNLSTGVYKISVRAQDNAGNWSAPVSDYLVVFDPAGPKMTGKKTIVPSLSNGDILPGLIANNQTDQAKFGFSVKYNNQGQIASNSDFMFSYTTGTHCNKPNQATNCHSLSLDAASIAWLTTQDTNNSTGIFQGTANMIVDGQSSSIIFRVTGVDGERLNSTANDRFQLMIYPANSNPSTDTPLYRVNSADIARGNVKIN